MIFYVEIKTNPQCCNKCGSRHVKKKGYVYRDFRGVPIGLSVIIQRKVQRLYCEECGKVLQEEICQVRIIVMNHLLYLRSFL
ncbi:MAG TPA: transposase family protein [Bacteroidetes bacterium]|nr:transposase family protein [Bacteroidota bacterium]